MRIGLGLWLLWAAMVPSADAERLVLIVGSESQVSSLSSVEVHKLFLGLTVIVDDRRLHPLRNDADPLMREVFFQNIVSMSESVYDRRMLALTLQQGGQVPPVLHSTKAVLDALAEDPNAVSFAWESEAAKDPRVRQLRVLWHR